MLEIESSHSRSERGVKQALCAHFTLIAMARLFASRSEREFGSRTGEADRPPLRANFSHSVGAVGRDLEALLLHQAPPLRDTLNRVLEHAARGPQRERPGGSYPRQSRRPSKKCRNRKPTDPQTADRIAPCLAPNRRQIAGCGSILRRMPLDVPTIERRVANAGE